MINDDDEEVVGVYGDDGQLGVKIIGYVMVKISVTGGNWAMALIIRRKVR